MTAAELVAWQRRCGIASDKQAAHALGLSTVTYRRKRGGRAPIGRQTELLCAYFEVFAWRARHFAAAVERIAAVHDRAVPPSAAEAARTIAKVVGTPAIYG